MNMSLRPNPDGRINRKPDGRIFDQMAEWGVWVGGPKSVGQNSRNLKAEIFSQLAENGKAENKDCDVLDGKAVASYLADPGSNPAVSGSYEIVF